MFKTVNDGFDWMVSFTNLEKKPDLSKRGYRLDKMFKLLDIFGNPQNSYKIIHVAGSKGKGSTCSFISSILSSEGYKVGIYSSPHLLDYRERITQNHNFFNNESYINAANLIKSTLKNIKEELPGGEPTTFELMTLAAFIIFKKEKCNWVVLETGIGGRLDSTNCVNPLASVITPIELEHCDLLGETIEEIAAEKAGIIKKNKPVFTSNDKAEVIEVIANKAKECNSELFILNKDFTTSITSKGTILYSKNSKYKLGLQGEIQGENALLAKYVVNTLLPNISDKSITKGLERCLIPGRFQIEKDIILDGAHTKNSITFTVSTFKKMYGDGIVIFGAVEGKNIDEMAKIIAENFRDIIISTPGNFKKSNLNKLKDTFNKYTQVIVEPSPLKALQQARSHSKKILVTGSFYMAGEIAQLLNN